MLNSAPSKDSTAGPQVTLQLMAKSPLSGEEIKGPAKQRQ